MLATPFDRQGNSGRVLSGERDIYWSWCFEIILALDALEQAEAVSSVRGLASE